MARKAAYWTMVCHAELCGQHFSHMQSSSSICLRCYRLTFIMLTSPALISCLLVVRTAHLDPIKRRTTLQLSHMSETGGSLLGHVESGNDSALQALFFVVIALFLGMQHHSYSQDKRHTEVQSSELAASAGTFTKQALAWVKIPFTALLLVTAVSLMAVSDFHSCFMSCCSKQMRAMTGVGSAAGNRQ